MLLSTLYIPRFFFPRLAALREREGREAAMWFGWWASSQETQAPRFATITTHRSATGVLALALRLLSENISQPRALRDLNFVIRSVVSRGSKLG